MCVTLIDVSIDRVVQWSKSSGDGDSWRLMIIAAAITYSHLEVTTL